MTDLILTDYDRRAWSGHLAVARHFAGRYPTLPMDVGLLLRIGTYARALEVSCGELRAQMGSDEQLNGQGEH